MNTICSILNGSQRFLVIALVTVSAGAQMTAGSNPDAALQVMHRARSLQPGEVVLVTVQSEATLESVQARAFEREFFFYPSSDSPVWEGLVGIDLQTEAGEHPLQVRATTIEGDVLEGVHKLIVEGKEFPVRRLTVPSKFVDPPGAELERIRRESRRVSEIFESITTARHWHGGFLRPVPGPATSSFGKRSILNGKPRSPHGGTDFNAEEGTPVQAPNAGKVVLASDLYYSGNTVILDHGLGLYSYFAHLSEIAVQEEDLVVKGELIGSVGSTGRVTGPHLHWTVRLSDARVDPVSLMTVLEEKE